MVYLMSLCHAYIFHMKGPGPFKGNFRNILLRTCQYKYISVLGAFTIGSFVT